MSTGSELPSWLTDLAQSVDPLIRKHGERFTAAIERWAERQRERGGLGKYGPFARLERGDELKIEDCYAVTAAIHYAVLPSFAESWGKDVPPSIFLDEGDACESDSALWLFQRLAEHVAHWTPDGPSGPDVLRTLPEPMKPCTEACIDRVEDNLKRKPKRTCPKVDDGEVTAVVVESEKSKYEALRSHFRSEELYEAHVSAWVLTEEGDMSPLAAEKINRKLNMRWKGDNVRQAKKKMRELLQEHAASKEVQPDIEQRADKIVKVLRKHRGYTPSAIPDKDWYGDPTDTHGWTHGPIPDLNGDDPTKYERTGVEAQARNEAVAVLSGGGGDKDAENAAKKVLDRWKRERGEKRKLKDGVATGALEAGREGDGSGKWDG